MIVMSVFHPDRNAKLTLSIFPVNADRASLSQQKREPLSFVYTEVNFHCALFSQNIMQ